MTKKILSIIVLTTFVLTLGAQTAKKSFNVTGFNGINAGGVFNIELIKSNKEAVAIEAETQMLEYINVEVSKDGVLLLSLDRFTPSKLQRNMKPILVTVHIKELASLNLSGASRLITDSQFSIKDFSANLSGASKISGLNIDAVNSKIVLSGASVFSITGNVTNAYYDITGAAKVDINQSCKNLKMEGSGAAKINFDGDAKQTIISFSGAVHSVFKGSGSDSCNLEMSGASNFNSLNFPVKDMVIKLSGVSNAKINVTDLISVGASGGSNIMYKGNPQIKNLDISSVSSFSKIN